MAADIGGNITEKTFTNEKSDVLSETGNEIFSEEQLKSLEKKKKGRGITGFVKTVFKEVAEGVKNVHEGFDEAVI